MAKTIENDMDLLAAALSQVRVSVWQADATDVYCEVDRGFIDKYTPKSVRVISEKTGQPTYYWRDSTLFVIE